MTRLGIRYYTRRIGACPVRQLDALSVTGKDISFQTGLYVHVWNGMSLGRSKPWFFCRSGTALNCQSGTTLKGFKTVPGWQFLAVPDWQLWAVPERQFWAVPERQKRQGFERFKDIPFQTWTYRPVWNDMSLPVTERASNSRSVTPQILLV